MTSGQSSRTTNGWTLSAGEVKHAEAESYFSGNWQGPKDYAARPRLDAEQVSASGQR